MTRRYLHRGQARDEAQAAAWRLAALHVDWYERTGHCGGCGEPGSFCQCTDRDPCGCRALHRMGSGIGADPTVVFADQPVSADQEELF